MPLIDRVHDGFARVLLATARVAPIDAVSAQKIPSAEKPPAASSVAPAEPASSQPMLAMVMLRPNRVPRNSLGISDRTAISDGRPVAFTSE